MNIAHSLIDSVSVSIGGQEYGQHVRDKDKVIYKPIYPITTWDQFIREISAEKIQRFWRTRSLNPNRKNRNQKLFG